MKALSVFASLVITVLLFSSGGLCYDNAGVSCGNPFSCSGGTVNISFDVTSATFLNQESWITDKAFPEAIGKHSRSFQKAIASFQRIVAANPKLAMKEYGSLVFHVVIRPHFPEKITVTHAGGSDWVVYLEKADTELEGERAPNMLEVVGNEWRLVSHQPHPDDEPAEKYVVASGKVR